MADLSSTSPWASAVPVADASTVPSNQPQPPSAERIVGRKIKVEKSVFSSSTGNTAFSVSAFFLAASYSPSSAAEVKARVSHIFRRF